MSWVVPEAWGESLFIVYGVSVSHEENCDSYTDDGCDCYKKYDISPEIKNTYNIKNYCGNAQQSQGSFIIGVELMVEHNISSLSTIYLNDCIHKLLPSDIEKLDEEFTKICGGPGSYLLITQIKDQ